MISEILDREFVLAQLDDILGSLKERASTRRGGQSTEREDGLSADDYAQAAEDVEIAIGTESATSSGPTGFDEPSQRRGTDSAAALDETCFISSDPIVSIAQSALEEYFNDPESPDHVKEEPVVTGTQRRGEESDATSEVTNRSIRPKSTRRVLDRFSVTDPGWVSSLVAMGISKFRSPHAFNPKPAPTHSMPDKCRLVMVGDWGSGLPRAQKVAHEMRKFVQESLAAGIECHVIHLGDVYYSGFEYEYKKRFLPFWPVEPGEEDRVGSWSLNGNHDMYSGGHAYYDTLLADPRFSRQARSSFFRLANKEWQFIGLDTAYEDNGLKDPQATWLAQTLAKNPQRSILLTHHQFYSAYENGPAVGKVLSEKLGPLLEEKQIFGAIWGHEHRCILYGSHGGLEYARLIGHGGVPVYMTHAENDEYPPPATFEDRRYLGSGLEHWAYMGFAVLDLDGPTIQERYLDEDGTLCRTETIRPGEA